MYRECSNGCGRLTRSEFGVCSSPDCRAAHSRAYYEANRERVRAQQNQKRSGVPATDRVPCGNYEICGSYIKAGSMVGFCKKTPGCKLSYERRYRELRGDLKREINQRWVDRNPEKARETWNRAQRRKKQKEGRICRYAECSNIIPPGWPECHSCTAARLRAKRLMPALKQALVERDGWLCSWCEKSLQDDFDTAVIDHVIPVTRGGPRDPQWNQQVLHPRCNRAKINSITDRARILAAEHGFELVRVEGKQVFRRLAPPLL